MRSLPLTVVKGGIDRGRPKGGVRADVLFDLVNAQITEEFKLEPREGTSRDARLPEGTVGLVAFEGELHVFASSDIAPGQEVFLASDDWTCPVGVTEVELLLVGGGGGAVTFNASGGGGGGGVIHDTSHAVTPGNVYPIVVGAGGTNTGGSAGEDTTFDGLAAVGGGGTGTFQKNGGSGGGGSAGSNPGGTGTVGQGNDGGDGSGDGSGDGGYGGGGGGAGAVGENAVALTSGGDGGAGLDFSSSFGTSVGDGGWFAGGGGGGRQSDGAASVGGQGGGGNGTGGSTSGIPSTAGTNGTGGGAGGGGTNGGSGVAILKYTPGLPDGYRLNILLHPFDSEAELTEIHFAEPFMGALYVVAEFDDGQIYHYWLQAGEPWRAETEYSANEFVTPTTPNGFVYRAVRLTQPFPSWTAGAPRTAGNGSSIEPSIIEPTVYNEYYYTAIETQGDNPTSATVEPVWPTETGETVVENADGFTSPSSGSSTPPTPPLPNTPQSSTTERYG